MTRQTADIGCIVLAAGSGTRFGTDKRQALLGGNTLLGHTLGTIAPQFSKRILVLHPGDEALAGHFAGNWQVLLAADARKGMGHSLAAAMACTRDWAGAVIALGDMPLVLAATYRAVRDALTTENLVVPHYHEQRGNPAGIGQRYFAELARLEGDQGARKLLELHAATVLRLAVDDPGILRDVDTPEALAAVLRGLQENGVRGG